ncbi:MAG: NAD(P)-binding domain-containing protein [Chloroflexota bacterium]|nr:NAD(P)-binding domain-containing protein [Chloroflexota bacterium]
MATDNTPTVGFIGLGAMGMGMARSLLRAGFDVRGYDVNPAAVEAFRTDGGKAAESAADAARQAGVLIVMVLNAEQADDALFGSGNAAAALQAAGPSPLVILCSTVSPAYAQRTAQRLAGMGIAYLDAPVSGGVTRAAEGALSVMASGSPQAFDEAAPVLDALSANVYRLGDAPGQGSAMKLVNQVLAGIHTAAAAEAIAFGAKLGIDPKQAYDVICSSAGASWMFEDRVPHILAGDYTPRSAIEIWIKDLGIILDAGKENRFPLPLAATAHQLFMMAAAAGYGRLDDSAVVKVFEKIADFHVVSPENNPTDQP